MDGWRAVRRLWRRRGGAGNCDLFEDWKGVFFFFFWSGLLFDWLSAKGSSLIQRKGTGVFMGREMRVILRFAAPVFFL